MMTDVQMILLAVLLIGQALVIICQALLIRRKDQEIAEIESREDRLRSHIVFSNFLEPLEGRR